MEVIMLRPFALLCLSACAVTALAQQTIRFGQEPAVARETREDTVVTAPQEVHRVAPPSADLTATQLEQKGDELRGEKNFADAIDYFSAAIDKQATAQLYNKRGMSKAGMMRFDDAKKDFEKALKADKKYAEAENNIGAMLHYQRKLGPAIKHYKRAIQLEQRATFYSNLGTAYFASKDYKKAQSNYQIALQLDPDVFERQRSRTATQFAAMTPQERAKYDYVIAKMYASRGDSERCLLYLRKAIEEGYPVAEDVRKDKEFADLRKDPRLKEILAWKPPQIN
jgi:tetratricopeptide (TPR) repeat protein